MRTDPKIMAALAVALALGLSACERRDGTNGEGADTLEIAVPEDAGERLEEAGREVGAAVGEGMEKAGEAIQGAGEEVQEEMREGARDTVRM